MAANIGKIGLAVTGGIRNSWPSAAKKRERTKAAPHVSHSLRQLPDLLPRRAARYGDRHARLLEGQCFDEGRVQLVEAGDREFRFLSHLPDAAMTKDGTSA